jgi:propionaldehyde dehydrogenase
VQLEMLMPVLPMVRVQDAGVAIREAVKAEHGFFHTAVMHSKSIDNLHDMARAVNTSLFVKNAPSYAGLGVGGEGYTAWTIAGSSGDGLTTARTYTRERRCTLKDKFRIV